MQPAQRPAGSSTAVIEPAKNPTSDAHFLQIVIKPKRAARNAFGLHQSGLSQDRHGVSRKFITGANWSAGISNPFRAFGSTGEDLESTLGKVRANATAPVICALHLASAYIQYADRGKSSIILTDDAEQPNE
jgi:hypothetical protein